MKVLYLIFLLVAFPNVSLSASFDCSKANTNIEHMICDSEELSEFDDQLGLTYEYAKENQNKDARIQPRSATQKIKSWTSES